MRYPTSNTKEGSTGRCCGTCRHYSHHGLNCWNARSRAHWLTGSVRKTDVCVHWECRPNGPAWLYWY